MVGGEVNVEVGAGGNEMLQISIRFLLYLYKEQNTLYIVYLNSVSRFFILLYRW